MSSSESDDGFVPSTCEVVIYHFINGHWDRLIVDEVPLYEPITYRRIKNEIKERWGFKNYDYIKFYLNNDPNQIINIYRPLGYMADVGKHFATFTASILEVD